MQIHSLVLTLMLACSTCPNVHGRSYRNIVLGTTSPRNASYDPIPNESNYLLTKSRPNAAADDVIANATTTISNDDLLDYEEVELDSKLRHSVAKQIGLPASPVDLLVNRLPCTCLNGVCGCCTGMLLSAFRSKGCMNITYIPEDFAFEVKMMMNDAVLYRRRMSGRNPRPICVNPPRLNFIELCANFYDIYFNGRNMHVCLDMDANFQGYQLFNRSFDCMRLGDQGVKIVKPDDDSLLPVRPQGGAGGGTDADIDAGDDDIDDYDELLSRQLQQ